MLPLSVLNNRLDLIQKKLAELNSMSKTKSTEERKQALDEEIQYLTFEINKLVNNKFTKLIGIYGDMLSFLHRKDAKVLTSVNNVLHTECSRRIFKNRINIDIDINEFIRIKYEQNGIYYDSEEAEEYLEKELVLNPNIYNDLNTYNRLKANELEDEIEEAIQHSGLIKNFLHEITTRYREKYGTSLDPPQWTFSDMWYEWAPIGYSIYMDQNYNYDFEAQLYTHLKKMNRYSEIVNADGTRTLSLDTKTKIMQYYTNSNVSSEYSGDQPLEEEYEKYMSNDPDILY